MERRSALVDYLRSPLHLAILGASGIGVAAALVARRPTLAPIALGLYLIVALLAFLIRGGKAIVAIREGDAAARNARAAERIQADLRRLAALRILDPATEATRQLLLLRAREYAAACAREAARDPEAERLIDESAELVNEALRALDAASSERRFAGGAAAAETDLTAALVGAIKDNSAKLRARTAGLAGAPLAEDLLAAKKELE